MIKLVTVIGATSASSSISTIPYFVYTTICSLKLKTPIIYTPHAHPFYTLNHPFRNRFFFHLFVKIILKKANSVVSINKKDYQFFCKYNKNVITIPHWSTRDIPYSKKDDVKTPKLLFVGRNDANKNLKALYSIPKDKYKITCVTNIKPKRDDFDFVSGLTDDELIELYSKSSLTVIPSRYEAFSYAAMESLLAGTPILVSDRVRIVDFLEGIDGVTQYKYEDENDLNNKLEKAIKQNVEIDKVRNIFSAEKAFEKYNSLYIHILGK